MQPVTAASNNVAPFAALSDDELVQKVKTLAACERRASVALIRSLIRVRRAQALARHAVPDGDLGSILDRALTLLIDHLERRRFARVASPRPGPGESTAWRRHIPAAVRREVWQRDEGLCAFIGRTGRCRETAILEFHHVAPYAAGGAATADNIQLRCRAHNQYEARLFFGDTFVRERNEVWPYIQGDGIGLDANRNLEGAAGETSPLHARCGTV